MSKTEEEELMVVRIKAGSVPIQENLTARRDWLVRIRKQSP